MTSFRVIVTTVAERDDAVRITRALLEERLAACVNMVLGVASFYWWEGKVCEEREFILLCKTRQDLVEAAAAKLREIHPYQVPEIIALPIEWGSEPYLAWIAENTRERSASLGGE